MLVQMAIGDAYGAGFEYASAEFVLANHRLTMYVQHPKHKLVPGVYTDDTQMSIANAEVILAGILSREAFAQAYVDCFKRDQREGYASGFYNFLCSVKDGEEFLSLMKPISDKSGSAMRALPFGIYPDIEVVIALATLQSTITHNSFHGINAAVAAALMSHYFLYQLGPKSELGAFIEKHVPGTWAEPYTIPVAQKGWMSVRSAITAIMGNDSMTEILRASVAVTGDVDTVAALALGAAAACSEVKQDLPEFLERDLENGAYGRDFLADLDAKLMAKMADLKAEKAASQQVAVSGPRILVVQSPEQWTGAINSQSFLEIPTALDVQKEENAWFAAGGDSSGKSFVEHLLALGATRLTVEVWNINYQ
ncbi:MAG: ADP-ribosylglycohydrolase family protein [Candidatus Obscuribacterales bacterium]|nr:ADP-ribosylglycohydrolase family protein [Candidatus Obscuribacterales bacterium]